MLLVQAFETIAVYFKAKLQAKYFAVSKLTGLGAMALGTMGLLIMRAELEAYANALATAG